MPLKGQVRARRKNYRKPRYWYNKKYSVKQIAYNALKGVTYLKGLVNAELKYHDFAQTPVTFDYNGVIHTLCEIAQGDDEKSRTGNSIFARWLSVRGKVERNSAQVTATTVRLMLVMDTFSSGAAISDILQNVGDATAPYSRLRPNMGSRFKIISTALITLDAGKAQSEPFKYNIDLKKHIKYNGSLSTDLVKNTLYLIAISDEVTTDLPNLTYRGVLKYYDN